jgi:phage-related holin
MLFVDFFMNNIYFISAFIFFFIVDFFLGFGNAYIKKQVSSEKMKKSAWKFVGYILVILSCIMFDVIIYIGSDIELLQKISPFAKIAIIFISINEFISVIENADKMGLYVPKFLKRLIGIMDEDINQ